MRNRFLCALGLVASVFACCATSAMAQSQKRLALVIGAAAYKNSPGGSQLNDAGLVAQALRELGFGIIEAADPTGADVRKALADYAAGLREAGPDSVGFVFIAGRGVQQDAHNYFLPVDATLANPADIALEAIRIGDITGPLSAIPARGKVIVLDVARPFDPTKPPAIPGLGIPRTFDNSLMAMSAEAGVNAVDNPNGYGAYALALVEMLRTPGLPVEGMFNNLRLRVHAVSQGKQTPWHESKIAPGLTLLPAPPSAELPVGAIQPARPRDVPAQMTAADAYSLAVERNSIAGYQEFLRSYPDDPHARRVKVLLARLREAVVWRQTLDADSVRGYWSYKRKYPRGRFVREADLRLAALSGALEPPAVFEEVVYAVPPVMGPVEFIDDYYGDVIVYEVAPPPPPVWLLPVAPVALWSLGPPAYVYGVLPPPVVMPVPIVYAPLSTVVAPPPVGFSRVIGAGAAGAVIGAAAGAVLARRALPGSPGAAALPVRPGPIGPAAAAAARMPAASAVGAAQNRAAIAAQNRAAAQAAARQAATDRAAARQQALQARRAAIAARAPVRPAVQTQRVIGPRAAPRAVPTVQRGPIGPRATLAPRVAQPRPAMVRPAMVRPAAVARPAPVARPARPVVQPQRRR